MDANTAAFFSALAIANYLDVRVRKGLVFPWISGVYKLVQCDLQSVCWLSYSALQVFSDHLV